MKKLILSIIVLLASTKCYAAAPDRPAGSVAVAGTIISSVAYNNDLNTIYNYLQNGVSVVADGTITNNSIATGAAIAYSKLNLTGGIVNADIATGAAIAYAKLNLASAIRNSDLFGGINDNKLNQISTSGKVDFNALSISGQTTGDLIYFNSPAWTRFAATSSIGFFLKSQGPGNPPVWADPAPGTTLKSSTTVTTASSTGNITLTAGKRYLILIAAEPQGADNPINLQFNADSGANYAYVAGGFTNGAAAAFARTTGATSIPLTPSLKNGSDMTCTLSIIPTFLSNHNINVHVDTWFNTDSASNGDGNRRLDGKYEGAANVTSFVLTGGANNISARVEVYEFSGS